MRKISISHSNKIFYLLLLFTGLIYISLRLSPSSYGVALDIFGYPNNTLLGSPKPIRSDEWSVWTPYLQMAINNDYQRFYAMPEYSIDLRGFNLLPLADVMLFFKPFIWAYFIFSPSIAFSIYHFLIAATFIAGWKTLTEKVLFPENEKKVFYATIFSFILYFSGFTQYWLTTLGPILSITPWLILTLLNKSKWRFILLFYVAVSWLVSHTYPPIIIQVAYLGGFIILIYERNWNRARFIDYFLKGIICVISVATVAYYFKDAITVMSQTVYPGRRVSLGGDGYWQLWLSTLFPYWIINGYSELINLNICEVGTVSSLLPLFTLCFITLDKSLLKDRIVIAFLALFLISTVWMFIPLPEWLAKITLLYLSPAHRGLYILGTAMSLLSIYLWVKGNIKINFIRVTLFSILMLFSYMLPSFIGYIGYFKKSAFELFCIVLVLLVYILAKFNKIILLLSVLAVSLSYTFLFNPLQPSAPIFDILKSGITNKFAKNDKGWVIESGYYGAILAGVGVPSLATTLTQPQLDFFRKIYPDMDSEKFNTIFNRYAHITLSNVEQPSNPYPDTIALPIKDFRAMTKINVDIRSKDNLEYNDNIQYGGYIDDYSFNENEKSLVLKGWSMSNNIILYTNQNVIFQSAKAIERNDVVSALNDTTLRFSGFEIKLNNIESIKELKLCLASVGEKFGKRLAQVSSSYSFYSCMP